jgi:hypothetical protein
MPTFWSLPTLVGLLALTASAVSAQPRTLSNDELRQTAAGFLDTYLILSVINVDVKENAVAISNGSGTATAQVISNVFINNNIRIDSSDVVITLPLSALGNLLRDSMDNKASNVMVPTWIPWSRDLWPLRGN